MTSLAETARHVVCAMAAELRPGIACEVDDRRGSINDTAAIILRQGRKKAFVVITIEALANATADPLEIRRALTGIVDKLTDQPQNVFLVTTLGVKEAPLGAEVREIQNPESWIPFEDWAASVEGDAIAETFSKRGH